MDRLTKYSIPLKSSTIVIAIAQLNGPFPDGKHKTVVNDRETFSWKSLENMKARLEKVYGILDELTQLPLKPDIVVFPEYSFPVKQAISELQDKANSHGFIIIAGADSMPQPDSPEILNLCPIILPEQLNPIWVPKRVVSQWEEGMVDEPSDLRKPILTWTVDEREFWISPHICLDFSLASEDLKEGGGIFIVPMASPDVMSFLGWADVLLRLPGGTATVLCNCVGGGAKGQSGVIAVNPGGKPFQAAFELSTTKEQVSVFELDLLHLSPPKKTPIKQRVYPLVRRFLYDVEAMLGVVHLQEVPLPDQAIRKRGVINPSIFSAVLGKKMRMAFLNVPQYAAVRKSVQGKDYEVLAILGKEDIMVTHLADDRYDMMFDVTQAVNWIGINNNTVTIQDLNEIEEDNFPHFRVDTFYKVLGVPVNEADRAILGSREKPFPNFADIGKLFKLGERWEDTEVSDEERTRFRSNRWILDITETAPGNINAVMTIRLQLARSEIKAHLLAKFEEKVVPELIETSQVTSLYRGSSPGLGIDYVLRLSLDLTDGFDSLYQLIERVHELSLDERLKADTTTYIVVKKLAQLSLSKAILVTKLSRDKRYRDRKIIPHLSNEDRVRLTYQSEKEQLELIDLFRPIDEALISVSYLGLDEEAKNVLLRRLVTGLFNQDYDALREVHDPLQTRVERALTNFLKDEIDDDEFKRLKDSESLPSNKTRAQLGYLEKIKAVAKFIEEARPRADQLPLVKHLFPTNKVRNAIVHTDADQRITMEEFTATLVCYCNFVRGWKITSNKGTG
jgi:hypothetical protein